MTLLNRLHNLSAQLKILPDKHEAKQANNLVDIMAGKHDIIKTPKALFSYLEENDVKVNIDSPKGSKKGFGGKKREIPFDYGEVVGAINVADNMFWDIIFPPSQSPDGVKKLIPIGIVKVNDDKAVWREKAKKDPPTGNDKVIVSVDGTISDDDKRVISDFFSGMWQFKSIKWF